MNLSIADLFREAETLDAGRNPAAAAELYKRWTALNPDDPHLAAALFNMAVVYQKAGDAFGAINALRQAIRVDPDFHPPYINLGRQLEDQGLAGAAVSQWLALATRLSAVNGPARRHKLMALQQVGRVLEFNHADGAAEDALRQAIDLDRYAASGAALDRAAPETVQMAGADRLGRCRYPPSPRIDLAALDGGDVR